jgi:hypothetical protein
MKKHLKEESQLINLKTRLIDLNQLDGMFNQLTVTMYNKSEPQLQRQRPQTCQAWLHARPSLVSVIAKILDKAKYMEVLLVLNKFNLSEKSFNGKLSHLIFLKISKICGLNLPKNLLKNMANGKQDLLTLNIKVRLKK